MVGQLQAVLNWVGFICLVYMATFAMIYGVGMELFSLDIPHPNSFFIDLFFIGNHTKNQQLVLPTRPPKCNMTFVQCSCQPYKP